MAAFVTSTSDYRVAPGEQLSFSSETGFQISAPSFTGPSPSLSIAGSVVQTTRSQQTRGISASASSHNDGTVTIEAGGSVRITANYIGGQTWGYNTSSFSQAFINRGVFEVSGQGTVIGVESWAGNTLVQNDGTLIVSAASWARGVKIANPSTDFVNNGLIDVTGGSGSASYGLETDGYTGSFLNNGVIRIRDGGPIYDAVAVQWAPTLPAGESWVNRGTIEGDYALKVYQYETSDLQVFVNEGLMRGLVDLGPRNGKLVNTGTIDGIVSLGGGDDIYAGRTGQTTAAVRGGDGQDVLAGGEGKDTLAGEEGLDTLTGGAAADRLDGGAGNDRLDGEGGDDAVAGGLGDDAVGGGDGRDYLRGDEGADTISGGAEFDDINGNMGADVASGGDGDDWVVGGKDNDQLRGDAGADIVYGNLGRDTCDGGAGADLVRGGQEDDVLFGGDGDDWLSGDRGADTLTGGAGADTFHISSDAGLDRVLDFSLAEGDRVQLDAGATYTVSQVGADTVIDLSGGAQMVLAGVQAASLTAGWVFGA